MHLAWSITTARHSCGRWRRSGRRARRRVGAVHAVARAELHAQLREHARWVPASCTQLRCLPGRHAVLHRAGHHAGLAVDAEVLTDHKSKPLGHHGLLRQPPRSTVDRRTALFKHLLGLAHLDKGLAEGLAAADRDRCRLTCRSESLPPAPKAMRSALDWWPKPWVVQTQSGRMPSVTWALITPCPPRSLPAPRRRRRCPAWRPPAVLIHSGFSGDRSWRYWLFCVANWVCCATLPVSR